MKKTSSTVSFCPLPPSALPSRTHPIPTREVHNSAFLILFLYRSYIVLIYFSYTSYIGDIRSIWEVYRKYMRRVLSSRSSTGCGILPVFVQNADCEQYISVFRCFSGFWRRGCRFFGEKGWGRGVLRGPEREVEKIFSVLLVLIIRWLGCFANFF